MQIVGQAELNGEYQRLRGELDAAYNGPVWNSSRIDRIAAEISQIEFALASFQSGMSPRSSGAVSGPLADGAVPLGN